MLAIYIMRYTNNADVEHHPGEHGLGALGGGTSLIIPMIAPMKADMMIKYSTVSRNQSLMMSDVPPPSAPSPCSPGW